MPQVQKILSSKSPTLVINQYIQIINEESYNLLHLYNAYQRYY